MARAFKCDRCGRYVDGEPKYYGRALTYGPPLTTKPDLHKDLCPECWESLREWLEDSNEFGGQSIHANWLKEEYFGGIFKCSNCGKYVDFRGLKGTQDPTNFCPNCGADMRKETEDE